MDTPDYDGAIMQVACPDPTASVCQKKHINYKHNRI